METGKLLTDRVADEIVRSIIGQKLKPGDKLPNEFELAKTLGVGRSTLREAIKTLVSRSVVEIRRGSGTFVSARSGVSEDPLGLEFLTDKVQICSSCAFWWSRDWHLWQQADAHRKNWTI